MASPQSCILSTDSSSNLEMSVFVEVAKPDNPEEKPSEQGREPKANSAHTRHGDQELNPGNIGGRRVLLPLRHPCSPWHHIAISPASSSYLLPFQVLWNHNLGIPQPSAWVPQDDRIPVTRHQYIKQWDDTRHLLHILDASGFLAHICGSLPIL